MFRGRFQFSGFSFQRGAICALVVLSLGGVSAQEEGEQFEVTVQLEGLEDYCESEKDDQMMRAYLRKRVHAKLDERLNRLEALETPEQIGAYQDRLREFFRKSIDLDSFEQGPLQPRVTGTLRRDGYSVEKVIFESLPGFSVTGNLYLPEGEGPFPGVLHPCGHSANGKAAEVYQMANILLARHGFVVLCYDPIGQGERSQLIDRKTGMKLGSPTGEHHALGVAPVLLGRGLSSYMIWDGMRGIDYLQSRPEVDPERIGCTGNSGGGNMTSFLMALDDRIFAAAPGCFMTTTRMKNKKPGPGDPEQNLFAQIREGLDHPDFALIRAPRPTLILAATRDFVPIEGTWDAFRQAKRVYTRLGFPQRVELIEAPEKHGFSRRLREGVARFFSRWLKEDHVEVFEPEIVATEKDADLFATPKGQVLMMAGERSLFEVNRDLADRWQERRREEWKLLSVEEQKTLVRNVTGIAESDQPIGFEPDVTLLGTKVTTEGDIQIFSLGVFEPEKGIKVAANRWGWDSKSESVQRASQIQLVCRDDLGVKKGERMPDSRDTEKIVVNLRDSGLSRTKIWRFYGADAWTAYMLGDSYLAMRTGDLIAVARALKAESDDDRPIHLHAENEFVPVALHSAALEPDLFESVTLHGGIRSWEEVIDSHDPLSQWHNVVHGALKQYDLPDLVDLIGKEKVTFQ